MTSDCGEGGSAAKARLIAYELLTAPQRDPRRIDRCMQAADADPALPVRGWRPLDGARQRHHGGGSLRRIGAALLGCSALWAGAPASAAEGDAFDPTLLSLEQLLDLDVQSASKFTQKASEAPSSVTVISAADIRRLGFRKLADILNSVRGLYVHYDRNYNYLGVRGFGPLGSYNSRVLVMIDGYRLNDPIYGQGSIGFEFPLDVDLIERVEFVPGPGSAIYGSNAFFGVVNVITRRGRALGGFEASAEAGRWDTYKGRLTWGQRYEGGWDALLSVSGYTSRGADHQYADFESIDGGVARGRDDEEAPSVFGKLSWGGFTLEAAHQVRKKGVPTASFESLFNGEPPERTRDAQNFAELRYDGSVSRDLDFSARVNRGSYDYRGTYPRVPEGGGPTIVNIDAARSSWWGSEVKLLSRTFSGHKIVLGAEYLRNTRKDQDNYDLGSSEVPFLLQHHQSWQTGLYAQDEFTLRPDLVLSAGLRHDHYSTFGSITNPRVALIYGIDPALTLKALFGKAYRTPTDGELFFESAALNWESNEKLRPERITTQELVGEWRISSLARATVSAFHYRITDLITLIGGVDAPSTYVNQGSARVNGAQFEFERLWRSGGSLRASYSYQRAHDEDGNRLPNSPRDLAKLDATVPLFGDALRAGLVLRYVGSRLSRLNSTVDAYTLADLTLSSERLVHGADVSLSIYNVLDTKYSDPVSDAHKQDTLRQDGRSIRLKVTASF